MKGIGVVGTGDCLHPAWRERLRHSLLPTGNGLYRLVAEERRAAAAELPAAIGHVRAGKLQIEPGYDGRFGTVSLTT